MSKESKFTKFNFALRQDQYEWLRERVDTRGLNMSQFIRILIDRAIKLETMKEQGKNQDGD